MSGDRRPHSRACGIRNHEHGPECHTNCPTCHGKPDAWTVLPAGMAFADGREHGKPDAVETDADRAWAKHLDECDQCNYDIDCFTCATGLESAHACNCPKGPGAGWLLRQETTSYKRNVAAMEQRERRERIRTALCDRLLASIRDELQGYTSDTHEQRACIKQLVTKLKEEAAT